MPHPIKEAPNTVLHRSSVTAVDTVFNDRERGANCNGYRQVHVDVAPSGGANPSVEVLVWNEGIGAFVSLNPPAAFGCHGADTGFSFSFAAEGRIIFVSVTFFFSTSGAVDVHLSGFGRG